MKIKTVNVNIFRKFNFLKRPSSKPFDNLKQLVILKNVTKTFKFN